MNQKYDKFLNLNFHYIILFGNIYWTTSEEYFLFNFPKYSFKIKTKTILIKQTLYIWMQKKP